MTWLYLDCHRYPYNPAENTASKSNAVLLQCHKIQHGTLDNRDHGIIQYHLQTHAPKGSSCTFHIYSTVQCTMAQKITAHIMYKTCTLAAFKSMASRHTVPPAPPRHAACLPESQQLEGQLIVPCFSSANHPHCTARLPEAYLWTARVRGAQSRQVSSSRQSLAWSGSRGPAR